MKGWGIRTYIAVLFASCLLFEVLLMGWLVGRHELPMAQAYSLLGGVLEVYSVPLAVIFGGMFADRNASRHEIDKATAVFASLVSVVWNIVFIGPLLLFVWSPEGTPDSISAARNLVPYANFLIASTITYVFSVLGRVTDPKGAP